MNCRMSKKLPLMEAFYSVQGEGFHSGRPAYFIRLAGCDVGCVWCDVKESWNAEDHPQADVEKLAKQVNNAGASFVVITGGEPAMYELTELTTALRKIGVEIAIETSGAHPITGDIDWICLSPKKFRMPLEENYAKADELKMIIFNKHDFQWAEELALKTRSACKLYMQPEWDKSEEMLPLIIDYVKLKPNWNISLQTHKYMNIP